MSVYPTATIFEIKLKAKPSELLTKRASPLFREMEKLDKIYPAPVPINKTVKEYRKGDFHYILAETPLRMSIVSKHIPTGKRFTYDSGRWYPVSEKEQKEKIKKIEEFEKTLIGRERYKNYLIEFRKYPKQYKVKDHVYKKGKVYAHGFLTAYKFRRGKLIGIGRTKEEAFRKAKQWIDKEN